MGGSTLCVQYITCQYGCIQTPPYIRLRSFKTCLKFWPSANDLPCHSYLTTLCACDRTVRLPGNQLKQHKRPNKFRCIDWSNEGAWTSDAWRELEGIWGKTVFINTPLLVKMQWQWNLQSCDIRSQSVTGCYNKTYRLHYSRQGTGRGAVDLHQTDSDTLRSVCCDDARCQMCVSMWWVEWANRIRVYSDNSFS